MKQDGKLDYVEFPAARPERTREFFRQAFGWSFEEFGPDYCAFSALLVFYSADLEATLGRVVAAGGRIEKPIFEFPGGRRFHFCEPSGNEFAVWSDRPAASNPSD